MDMTFNPYGQIHFSSRQDLKRIQAVVRSSFFIVFGLVYPIDFLFGNCVRNLVKTILPLKFVPPITRAIFLNICIEISRMAQ